jgi:glycosyltransferase involved in cell wall biosynthesis
MKSGAVPWVLGDGVAGTLVDVASAEALSAAIVRLLADNAALQASAAAGFSHVQKNFSLEHVVDLYEAQYDTIVAGNR